MQMAREGGLWADLVGRAKTRRWGCVLSVHAAGRDCVSHEQPCRSWLPLITPKVAPSYRAAKTSPWLPSAVNTFPVSFGTPSLASRMDACVLQPVVAPQSRSHTTARFLP